METRDELSTTLYLQYEIKSYVKMPAAPGATSLHHCLKNKQLILNAFSVKDPAKGVVLLCTVEDGVGNTCILPSMQLERHANSLP